MLRKLLDYFLVAFENLTGSRKKLWIFRQTKLNQKTSFCSFFVCFFVFEGKITDFEVLFNLSFWTALLIAMDKK